MNIKTLNCFTCGNEMNEVLYRICCMEMTCENCKGELERNLECVVCKHKFDEGDALFNDDEISVYFDKHTCNLCGRCGFIYKSHKDGHHCACKNCVYSVALLDRKCVKVYDYFGKNNNLYYCPACDFEYEN